MLFTDTTAIIINLEKSGKLSKWRRINSNSIHMPPKGSAPSSHYTFISTFVPTSFTNEIPIARRATDLIQTSQI